MSAWTIGALLALGCSILFRPAGRLLAGMRLPARTRLTWSGQFRQRLSGQLRGRLRGHLSGRLRGHLSGRLRGQPDPWLWPMLVYQLAALLHAGRAPQTIWRDLIRTHSPTRDEPSQLKPTDADEEVLAVLAAADRAAALGQGVAPVLRRYAGTTARGPTTSRAAQRRTIERVCSELADCWEVAERSGAPLASLLHRYASALEAELDAEAARRSALAGPRATVTLLSWLPLFGLGLGMLMGVDPWAVFLGSPIGLGALILGGLLMVLGRRWSSAMVAAARRDH